MPPQQPRQPLGPPAHPYGTRPIPQAGWDQQAYPGDPAYPGYSDPGEYAGPARYPPAPSGGGGGRRGLALALGVFLALALAGGGVAAYILLGRHTTSRPAAHGSPSSSPTATSRAVTHSRDLRTYLIGRPSGSNPWPTPLGTHRRLSLIQAAGLNGGTREILTRYHFTHGAVRCWLGAHGSSIVDVRLFAFDSAQDAQGFFRDAKKAQGFFWDDVDTGSTPGRHASAKSAGIAGVPGARAYFDAKPDHYGYVHVIALGIKADVVFVVSAGEPDTVDLGLPAKLMRRQYHKL